MQEKTAIDIQMIKQNSEGGLKAILENCSIIADWKNNNPDVEAAGGLGKFCFEMLGFKPSKTAKYRMVGYWLVNQVGTNEILRFGFRDFTKIYYASQDAEDGMPPMDALRKWVDLDRPSKPREAGPLEKAFADRYVKKMFEEGLVSMKTRGWTEAQTTERMATLMIEIPDQVKAVFEAMEVGG
jgi:hypothetical protein